MSEEQVWLTSEHCARFLSPVSTCKCCVAQYAITLTKKTQQELNEIFLNPHSLFEILFKWKVTWTKWSRNRCYWTLWLEFSKWKIKFSSSYIRYNIKLWLNAACNSFFQYIKIWVILKMMLFNAASKKSSMFNLKEKKQRKNKTTRSW